MPKRKEEERKTLMIGSLFICITSGLHRYFFSRNNNMVYSLHHVSSAMFQRQTETMKSASLDYFHLVFVLHSLPSHNFFKM